LIIAAAKCLMTERQSSSRPEEGNKCFTRGSMMLRSS
jgi:hypothetical protein